jgi:hypothetical protein
MAPLLSAVAVTRAAAIMHTRADLPLRRQDSNLDHRNQNPRCCLYTTADWPPILARPSDGSRVDTAFA